MPEKTLLLIKPDGVERRLENEILFRIEKTGLIIEAKKSLRPTAQQAAELYSPHLGKEFYPGLIKFITSGPIIACRVTGANAIARVRELMGATDPRSAAAGTIRGDFKEDNVISEHGTIKNLVHGSDSPESAERELAIFFS